MKRVVSCTLLVCGICSTLVTTTLAQPYLFRTVVGQPGLRSVDGTNNAALLGQPSGIARDSAGNFYMADALNHTIRRLSLQGTNWVVTTLAGLAGQSGSADGTNSNARFNLPQAVAVDSATNIYVADCYNHAIRKVAPVGTNWVVSTWAGMGPNWMGNSDGPGPAARFRWPTGIAIDGANNLYVADLGNATIRKIVPSGSVGTVSTLVGGFNPSGPIVGFADGTNRAALFNSPYGVAVDSSTNLYVADGGNHAIRKVTRFGSNWAVTTPTGIGGSPGSTDGTNNTAQFNLPESVTIDSSGNLYVADGRNHTIRKVTLFGTNYVVSTVAGLPGTPGAADGTNSDARFVYPQGLAVDGAGNLLVADCNNGTVRQISPQGTNFVVFTIAGSATARRADGTNQAATFWNPACAAFDSAGNLYVTDPGNYTVRRISASGTNWVVTTLAGLAGCPGTNDGVSDAARFNGLQGIAVDGATNIYVTDNVKHTIRRISPLGTNWVVSTLAGTPGVSGASDGTNNTARFFYPWGIALDGAGNLLVSDSWNHAIRKLTPVGTDWVVTTVAGVVSPMGFGAADGTNSTARFFNPQGISSDNWGNVYVVDSANNLIRKMARYDTNWVVTTIAGDLGSGAADGTNRAARFLFPGGVCADSLGNLFVADTLNRTIRKVTPQGTNWVVTTVGGLALSVGIADGVGSNARFGAPLSVSVDTAGNLWIVDAANDTIRLGQPLPSLSLSAAPGKAVLSWPLSASNFLLETSTTLAPGSTWTPLSDGITATPTGFVRTNDANTTGAFFRLRSP